jgi:hypothetical protein
MGIFLIYIVIIGPLSCFDCTNFKNSLVIKIINFDEIKNMAHLIMLVIFHVNAQLLVNFSIYHIFVEITFFLR